HRVRWRRARWRKRDVCAQLWVGLMVVDQQEWPQATQYQRDRPGLWLGQAQPRAVEVDPVSVLASAVCDPVGVRGGDDVHAVRFEEVIELWQVPVGEIYGELNQRLPASWFVAVLGTNQHDNRASVWRRWRVSDGQEPNRPTFH